MCYYIVSIWYLYCTLCYYVFIQGIHSNIMALHNIS
nr:MAG TPA: hypothetical protein [Caudoviricetes sp.]